MTVQRWTVGPIEVVRVVDDDILLPADEPLPDWCVAAGLTPSTAEQPIAFSALAVRSGDVRLVVDPWLANDHPRQGPDAGDRAQGLLDELADAGFPPDLVDLVVNTHIDGIGWNTRPGPDGWVPSFPHARYSFPEVEVDDARRGFHDVDALVPLFDAGVVDLVPADFTAPDAGDAPIDLAPGVSLVNAPGHNSGHVAVRIDGGDDLAIYAGHLFLTPPEIATARRDDDEVPALAEASRRAVLDELADRRGLLLTTLIGGTGGGRVERDGDGYRLAAHL